MPRRNRNAGPPRVSSRAGLVAVISRQGDVRWRRRATVDAPASGLWSPIDDLLFPAWRGRRFATDVTGDGHQPPTAEQRAADDATAAAAAASGASHALTPQSLQSRFRRSPGSADVGAPSPPELPTNT